MCHFSCIHHQNKKAKLHEHQISLSLLVQPLRTCTMDCNVVQLDDTCSYPYRQPHTHTGGAEQALLTSDKSIQYGTHWLVLAFHSQPQSHGFGMSGILERDGFQTNPAVWRAHLACWKRAFWVGGMEESRDLRPWVNISFLASLTDWAAQFWLYISTIKRSRRLIWRESSIRLAGSGVMAVNVVVACRLLADSHHGRHNVDVG